MWAEGESGGGGGGGGGAVGGKLLSHRVQRLCIAFTPSLPWHQLKMTNNSVKSETFEAFLVPFCTGMWLKFYQNSIEVDVL